MLQMQQGEKLTYIILVGTGIGVHKFVSIGRYKNVRSFLSLVSHYVMPRLTAADETTTAKT